MENFSTLAKELINEIKQMRIMFELPPTDIFADVQNFLINDLTELQVLFQTQQRMKYVVKKEDVPKFANIDFIGKPPKAIAKDIKSIPLESCSFKFSLKDELKQLISDKLIGETAANILGFIKEYPEEEEYVAFVFFPTIFYMFISKVR